MKKKCWIAMAAALALAAVLTGCGKETQGADATASAESAVNTEPIETNEEMETESVEETKKLEPGELPKAPTGQHLDMNGIKDYLDASDYQGILLVNKGNAEDVFESDDYYFVGDGGSFATEYREEDTVTYDYEYAFVYCSEKIEDIKDSRNSCNMYIDVADNFYYIGIWSRSTYKDTLTVTTTEGNVYEMTVLMNSDNDAFDVDPDDALESEIEKIKASGFQGLKLIVLNYGEGTVDVLNDGDEYDCGNKRLMPYLYCTEIAEQKKDNSGQGDDFLNFFGGEFDRSENCSYINVPNNFDKTVTITVTTVDGNVYEITNRYVNNAQ